MANKSKRGIFEPTLMTVVFNAFDGLKDFEGQHYGSGSNCTIVFYKFASICFSSSFAKYKVILKVHLKITKGAI